jgi:hypothetical protein
MGRTILGTRPARPPQPTEELGVPKGRDVERVLAAELLAAFRYFARTNTEMIERLAGRVFNHVLLVKTAAFDALLTPLTENFHTPIGAVEVTNASTHTVWVMPGGPGPGVTAPTSGVGLFPILASSKGIVPIGAHNFTIYGGNASVAGDQVAYQVYTTALRPVAT